MRKTFSLIFLLALFLVACSPRRLPYKGGPIMDQQDIERTFKPILAFMDYKPGMTFADVGAGSGALTVMMATLMEDSDVYIQDIDSAVLNPQNVKRIIDYYSAQGEQDLRLKNNFRTVIGSVDHTNLSDGMFDIIYSNATVHNFTAIDSIMVDLGRKLKPSGLLVFRDSFLNYGRSKERCTDPTCARPLLSIEEFLGVMNRNGYKVVRQVQDMSGYPAFAFTK